LANQLVTVDAINQQLAYTAMMLCMNLTRIKKLMGEFCPELLKKLGFWSGIGMTAVAIPREGSYLTQIQYSPPGDERDVTPERNTTPLPKITD
jgi:hypothetical protein